MKRVVIGAVLAFVIQCEDPLAAQDFMDHRPGLRQQPHGQTNNGLVLGPSTTYLGPIKSNAYGPGIKKLIVSSTPFGITDVFTP